MNGGGWTNAWLVATDKSFVVEHFHHDPDQFLRVALLPGMPEGAFLVEESATLPVDAGVEGLSALAFRLFRLPEFLQGQPWHATGLLLYPRGGIRRHEGMEYPTPAQR